MKRILLINGHPIVRSGIKEVLTKELSEIEFGEVSAAENILKKLNEHWDAIILDMNLPGRNGWEILKTLKESKTKIPILVYSMYSEQQIAMRALKSGASGYLSKNCEVKDLSEAVKTLLHGRKYITLSLAERLANQFTNPFDKPVQDILSDREYQTLMLLATGKTISEIAKELSLSVPTISTYRARILEKMGMRNNAELITYAINNMN